MTQKQPVIRSTNWLMVIPQLLVMVGVIILIAVVVRPDPPVLAVTLGAGIYLIYSYGIRWLLLRPHKQGLQAAFREDYKTALANHQTSYNFFQRYPWIDRYRAITLMSPSAFSYTEMALMNIAYCYSRQGNIRQAKAYYKQIQSQFPDNEVARAALDLIQTIEKQQKA